MVERLGRIEEARGSIPLTSTPSWNAPVGRHGGVAPSRSGSSRGPRSSGYVAGGTVRAPKGGVMRVVVDFDLCESNAVCMGIAPEVFEVRDDDFLYVLQEEPDESLRSKVEEAVARCPKQAIAIEG